MATSFNDSTDNKTELESYTMSVGISFVNAYYKQLGEDPAGLGSFFAADSAFTWSDNESSEPASVSFGRDAIVQRLKQLKLDQANVRITSVTCQPSANHAVLVQVVGDITPNATQVDQQFQFAQVFYLVKVAQKFRYYCYNDCFRYIGQVPQPESAPVSTQEETEYTAKAQPSPPVSPQRHESSVLGGSDPIVTTSHPAPSAGVIGPASSTSSTTSTASAAKDESAASPVLAVGQFAGGSFGAIGSGLSQAQTEQSAGADWAAEDEEEPEVSATPEPETTHAPAPAPAPETTTITTTTTRQPREQAAPAQKKGWGAVEKPVAVPISKTGPTPQQVHAAAAQEESEEEESGKPVSFLEAIKRKQRKAAQAAPVTVVQAPAAAKPATAGWGQESAAAVSGRAKLAQDRKEYEAREAAARRPREQPERRPRAETPRFGVFVGKMPSEAAEKDVIEVFQGFGPVANVRIPQGKRVAFVDFQTDAGRNAAIAAGKANILGQQVVITEPQANPSPASGQQGGQGPKQQGGNQGGNKGKEAGQGPRPKAGAKTGGK